LAMLVGYIVSKMYPRKQLAKDKSEVIEIENE